MKSLILAVAIATGISGLAAAQDNTKLTPETPPPGPNASSRQPDPGGVELPTSASRVLSTQTGEGGGAAAEATRTNATPGSRITAKSSQ